MKPLGQIFDVRYGHSLELNRLKITTPEAGVPFVSRKSGDNGIAAYVERVPGLEPNPAGELTCALSGNGVLSTFIQEQPYYTAFHVACLTPKRELSVQQLLYYCVCIKANRYRFSYGRQANRTLKDILLPSPEEIPVWVATATPTWSPDTRAAAAEGPLPALDTSKWALFELRRLFKIRKGKRLTKADMTPGSTPFIGAVDGNNGLVTFVGQDALHPENTITVNYNGNGVAEAFYQATPFRCSDDVNVLYPLFAMTPEAALFICSVIRQEKYRFNYGRKWNLERMEQSEIRLPTDAAGEPDFAFMAQYVRALPFSSQIAPAPEPVSAAPAPCVAG